jgi:hypothetical protein
MTESETFSPDLHSRFQTAGEDGALPVWLFEISIPEMTIFEQYDTLE